MKVDIPEIKRCCFCMPLRYGLIVWGYVKIVIMLLVITFTSMDLSHYIKHPNYHLGTFFIVEQSILLFCVGLDVIFDLLFLVGGYRKSIKLLNIYYIYSIVMLCLFTIFFTLMTGSRLYFLGRDATKYAGAQKALIPTLKLMITLALFFIGIQTYMVILTRFEINKLKSDVQFRFTNIAAEAQCTLENGTDKQGTDDLHEMKKEVKKEGINEQNSEIDGQFFAIH